MLCLLIQYMSEATYSLESKLNDKFFGKLLMAITYIFGHYNPSVRIINLTSHLTYVECVNFIHKWLALQFKVDSEQQIL